MTSKQMLLVGRLPDEQADELLRLVRTCTPILVNSAPLPAFVGIGDSGRSDVSERADELPRGGFGR